MAMGFGSNVTNVTSAVKLQSISQHAPHMANKREVIGLTKCVVEETRRPSIYVDSAVPDDIRTGIIDALEGQK